MNIKDLLNLEANERLKRLRWSVYIRYLVLGVVGILVFLGDQLGAAYSLEGVVASLLLGLLYNTLASYLYHRGRFPSLWPYVGIVVDMAVITLVVHFTGGVESVFLLLYVLQIVGTNVHFSRIAGPLNFAVGGSAFVLLALLEWNGTIPHVASLSAFDGAYQDPAFVLTVGTTLVALMGISAYRSGYVIQSLESVEHELAGINDQLLKANESLALANRRLQEVDHLKTEFISVASHQLRTPLSAVKWVLKMVLDGDLGPIGPEQRDMLAKGYQSNERMIALINDLLDVSRIEEGRFEYHFAPGPLADVIDAAVIETRPTIERKQIVFRFERPAEPVPAIFLDRDKLRLAIENLLDNALKYTPEGGAVTVRLKHDPSAVSVEVEDGGVGIPSHQQDRVFGKFFRGDNVVRMQTEGTGLGLFIARRIVEAHHGQLSFVSREGIGSTFTLTLPKEPVLATTSAPPTFEAFMRSF